MGLTSDYAQIWNDSTLLLVDNSLANDRQRHTIRQFLGIVPSALHNTSTITINDFLGNMSPYQDKQYSFPSRYGGVNIFGVDIGGYSENSFPADVTPGVVDSFTVVLAHEITHVIDAFAVEGNPVLSQRRQDLLAAAGNDSRNYLRSMCEDGFFTTSPQEFVASIGNQWFTDSGKTIDLGLARFDAGRPQPLNQALFLAEIFSLGSDTTFFYTADTDGEFTCETVPLGRDANGYLNELVIGGKQYLFDLNANGNVTGYTILPEPATLLLLALGGLTVLRRRRRGD